MSYTKKTKIIRRTPSGKTVETVREEVINDVFKDKRTTHDSTISLMQEEIDEIRDGAYTAFRITNTNTGEVCIARNIAKILNDAKRIPRRCKDTDRFLGFTRYFVAKFR